MGHAGGRYASARSTLVALAAALSVWALGCTAHVDAAHGQPAASPAAGRAAAATDWDGFWRARSVSPAPPRTMLDDGGQLPEIFNLTHGLIDDDVARRWILADIRRGNADAWAAHHLRLDVVNAGVLGPPGLNGSDRSIVAEKAAGSVEISCTASTIVAAGVIDVSKAVQQQIAWAELTDFVIVQVFRASGVPCKRTRSDGTTDDLPTRRRAGDLLWQLDTGAFRDDPIIGPVWYQARGWACAMDGSGELDEICALVRPSPRTLTVQ
jgi:hypothetical protein